MSRLLSGSRRTIAPHHRNPAEAQRRWRGRGTAGLQNRSRLSLRAPLPTTDALSAQEVEQKMSNLLAGFSAAQSFLDRTKHCTETQLAAAETSLPAHRSSNPTCLGEKIRTPMRCRLTAGCAARNMGEILPGDRDRLGRVTQIRVRATCQRDDFSLCTSKFESDMPSHAVGLPECSSARSALRQRC